MSEKKNIDQFFKERLEHNEVPPPPMAWDHIEAQLRAKKKRRVIPFWWKLSGTAAVLLLAFTLWGPYSNHSQNPGNAIVNQENNSNDSKKTNPADNGNSNIGTDNQHTVTTPENLPENLKQTEGTTKNEGVALATGVNTADAPAAQTTHRKKASEIRGSQNGLDTPALASTAEQKTKQNSKSTKQKTRINPVKGNDAIASNTKDKNTGSNNQNTIPEKTNRVAVQPNTTSDQDKDSKNTSSPEVRNSLNTDFKDKKILASTIETDKKTEEIKKIDSTKLASVEPNALEELLNEKEKKIAKGRKENRWQVTPNIAPIYFSSMSDGSPLDEKLASNEKVYGTNYSYGLGVNYAVNKKLKVRAGINTFSADYDTRNIVFYQTSSASKMQNVTPNLQGSLIQIEPLMNVNTSFGRLIDEKFEGTLNQRMGYIEMPMEVSYQLLAKKFGIDLIGGFSTLFLTQNDVYLKSPGFTMKIGEANNLNDIHFSTNIGLGLKYSFFKRFDARVEPVFKYQLNTYSSGAGNFKPYIFGIYSGISYRF